MNKDIKIMIQLQDCWNKILYSKSEIEKSNNKIKEIKNEIVKKTGNLDKLKNEIKILKNTIKENEVDLAGFENKLKKLNERINFLKSEREVEAQNREIEKIKEDISGKEESLILLMDELDAKEKLLDQSEADLVSYRDMSKTEIEKMELKINEHGKIISNKQTDFDRTIENLSPSYKPKFLKLLNTKSGKAIGEIMNNICGSCNFQIPSFLTQESLKEENVVTCTNCGRFLYSN